MPDEKATLEETLEKVPQPTEGEAAKPTEVEPEATEAETPEAVEPETDEKNELVELKERLIRAEARSELLQGQLENVVINQIAPQKDEPVVVDDGFIPATDEEINTMSQVELYKYQKREAAHGERVRAAQEAKAEEREVQTNPQQKQVNLIMQRFQADYPKQFEELRFRALAIAKKDESEGKPWRDVSEYLKEAKQEYEKIYDVSLDGKPKVKPLPKKEPPKVVSVKPSSDATGQRIPATDLESAIDAGMKDGFGNTGRTPEF